MKTSVIVAQGIYAVPRPTTTGRRIRPAGSPQAVHDPPGRAGPPLIFKPPGNGQAVAGRGPRGQEGAPAPRGPPRRG